MKTKEILTTGEIARFCSVNFRTVLRWIDRGELRAYKLPGRGDNRVRFEDFLEFLRIHDMPVPKSLQPAFREVLVVEDEPRLARSMCRTLKRAGFEATAVHDGFRAGTCLGRSAPGVVTLDLQMPGLSGMDVLSFIRETPGLEHTRILVVSGLDDVSLQRALDAGADDVLAKPYSGEQLVTKVTALFEQFELQHCAV